MQSPGKAPFSSLSVNSLSLMCQCKCEVGVCVCTSEQAGIKDGQSFMFQQREHIPNKKIKSWLDYSDTILVVKFALDSLDEIRIVFFPKLFHKKYLRNKMYLSLPNLSEKNKFPWNKQLP